MERTSPTTRPMPLIATAIVVLTLTTAYIHLSLGGPLFTLNALGYAALAVAWIAIATLSHPLIQRFDWMPRIGLAGYVALTIVAYLVIGPYFTLGWIAKAIEVAILILSCGRCPERVRHAGRTGWSSSFVSGPAPDDRRLTGAPGTGEPPLPRSGGFIPSGV